MNEDIGKPSENFSVVKRCPKCFSLSLSYDPKIKKLKCSNCGFEQRFR